MVIMHCSLASRHFSISKCTEKHLCFITITVVTGYIYQGGVAVNSTRVKLTHIPKSQLDTSRLDTSLLKSTAHTQQFNCWALHSCQKVWAVPQRWLRLRLKLCSLVSHSILTQAHVILTQTNTSIKQRKSALVSSAEVLANKVAFVDVHVTVLKESAVIWQQTKSTHDATARLFHSTSGKVLMQASLLCARLSELPATWCLAVWRRLNLPSCRPSHDLATTACNWYWNLNFILDRV